MELMSAALFCALLALCPLVLGKSTQNSDSIKYESVKSQEKTLKQTLWDVNEPAIQSGTSELQAVFTDAACSACVPCMERAIKSHRVHYHVVHSRPSAEELNSDALQTDIKQSSIDKRDLNIVSGPEDTDPISNTRPEYHDFNMNKKVKTKKTKSPKTVSVTKYYVKDEVYALKVNELGSRTVGNSNNTITISTCLVYNVKKSAPCNSPESELLLSSAKRKAVKRVGKNNKAKLTTEKTTTVMYRKRETDQSGVDQTMFSFEDYS